MGRKRRKEIKQHLSEPELDEKLAEADDDEIVRRLSFLKNLYQGDLIREAANRVGRSESTGDRWADDWNDGGLDGLAPSFRGGRPSKLNDDEQAELIELLRADQSWKPQEIQHLLNEEFGVEYHPASLSRFLHGLGLSYSISRTKRPSRPDNAEEICRERVGDALDGPDEDDEPYNKREGDEEWGWELDEDICTDGGLSSAFSMHHTRSRGIIRAVFGTSMIPISNDRWFALTNQRSGSTHFSERASSHSLKIRRKNEFAKCSRQSVSRIRWGGFCSSWIISSRIRVSTRVGARPSIGIDLIFLPVGSPDLNPIESVWKSLKWELSPLVVESADEFRALVTEMFERLTRRVSFASNWITRFLDLQKFR